MKAALIAIGIFFALYVVSQNQTAPLATPPIGPTAPAGTTALNALAVSSIVNVSNPGVESAYCHFCHISTDELPAGNDFLLNPVIASGKSVAPRWWVH